MKNKFALGGILAVLVLTLACGSSTNTNTNANKTAASPSPSAAATPKPTAASSPATSTEGSKGFSLVNMTGVEIHSLYITPSNSKDWQDDILGRDTLPEGEKTDITFTRPEKGALWDMRIEDSAGNSIEWTDLNLLELKKVTLYYKNGKATAETE